MSRLIVSASRFSSSVIIAQAAALALTLSERSEQM
jgi:hypothetical protein